MNQKASVKDMIILLPGIMGSVLQKDGKDLWAVSGQAIWNVLTRSQGAIQNLVLEQDDSEAPDLGDGIKATRIMPDSHMIPGFFKVDGYTQTIRFILENLDVIQGDIYNDHEDKAANFYHFPYDWRRDNRANAHILKSLIKKRLKCWREASGAQDAKVVILAHSMGGLISRYYLEVLQGWQDARALITFGTPYRGAFDTLNLLSNGYKKLFLDFTEVVRSFTSAYQLLPIYEGVKVGSDYLRAAEIANLPNIDQRRTQAALAFHREIEAAVEKNLLNESYRTQFRTVPVVGVSQPTMQSAELANGRITVSPNLPEILQSMPDLSDGDGTVPQVSAIPIELSSELNGFFIAESHGALQYQKQVLHDLKKKVAIAQFDISTVRESQAAIGLAVDDLYLPDEAIALRAQVTASTPVDKLTAIITPVSYEAIPLSCPFEQHQNSQWFLTLDTLPAGLYRVAVSADGQEDAIPTVHNLFEVVRQ